MKRYVWTVAALAACLVACDTSSPPTSTASPGSSSPRASSASSPAPSTASAGVEAERVQQALTPALDKLASAHGEGSKSPCSPAQATLFTPACAAMAKDASALAETALSEVKGKQGFGTLRKVAMSTREAAAQYAELNCTSRPTKLGDQEGCRKHAAVIAQAAQDMRDGVNLGLTGR